MTCETAKYQLYLIILCGWIQRYHWPPLLLLENPKVNQIKVFRWGILHFKGSTFVCENMLFFIFQIIYFFGGGLGGFQVSLQSVKIVGFFYEKRKKYIPSLPNTPFRTKLILCRFKAANEHKGWELYYRDGPRLPAPGINCVLACEAGGRVRAGARDGRRRERRMGAGLGPTHCSPGALLELQIWWLGCEVELLGGNLLWIPRKRWGHVLHRIGIKRQEVKARGGRRGGSFFSSFCLPHKI